MRPIPYVVVPAKSGEIFVDVLMDVDDYGRLGPRKLSIGSHGYPQMWLPDLKRMTTVHRWVLGVVEKTGYQFVCDHTNGEKLDNRKSNLRKVTPSESNMNRVLAARVLPTNIVLTKSGKFAVAVKRKRKSVHHGVFDTVEEAVIVRDTVLDIVGRSVASGLPIRKK